MILSRSCYLGIFDISSSTAHLLLLTMELVWKSGLWRLNLTFVSFPSLTPVSSMIFSFLYAMGGDGVCFSPDEFELYVKKQWDHLDTTDSHHSAMDMSGYRCVWACAVISIKGNCQIKDMLFKWIFWKTSFTYMMPELLWDIFQDGVLWELLKPSLNGQFWRNPLNFLRNWVTKSKWLSHILAVMSPVTR